MNKIVVLGSSGYIGSNFIHFLYNKKIPFKAMIHSQKLSVNCEVFNGDILNKKTLENNISSDDMIVNFVGQIDNDVSKFIDINIKGILNLLNIAIKKKPKKIILISSINVYGNSDTPSTESDQLFPKTQYGLIKLLTEKICENYASLHNLNITILRLAHVYGPSKNNEIISNIISSLYDPNYELILNNNGNQQRDFLYIEDVINGIISAIKTNHKGFNIFNISSGQRYSLNQIIEMIAKISGKSVNVKYISQHKDENSIWANNFLAKEKLDFLPKIELFEGLKLSIKNYRND